MRPPDIWLSLAEPFRTFGEAAMSPFVIGELLRRSKRGDGHTVMVLPGFMASGASTYPLRYFLSSLGYRVREWGLGRNLGSATIGDGAVLENRLESVATEGKVSLVGWSLGGVMARELAKKHPHLVRRVITLGSPFAGGPAASHVWKLYKMVTGVTESDIDPEAIAVPPPVPSTAIYSKTDGVVHWMSCIEPEGKLTESVEVDAAHCALGVNREALWLIADRLRRTP